VTEINRVLDGDTIDVTIDLGFDLYKKERVRVASVRTELVGGVGKYGRLLGWLYIGDESVSLNEQMITEGYAHAYDGGTKDMNLEALREIRRAHGTLVE
jgi:micrococcal nuclease